MKSHSSNLGFEIRDAEAFAEAIAQIRAEIEDIGDAFDTVLARLDLPTQLQGAGGNTCLAEQLVTGTQVAPEGSMFGGEFAVHGVFDMHRDAEGTSIERLDYPASSVPGHVQQRMIEITERYLRRVGFDDGCFNSEFMWDAEADRLWLIEVNTRISQSHSELFVLVDGMSNHAVAIDIALGEEPAMSSGGGEFSIASQCMVYHDDDAVVTRVPTRSEIDELERAHPWCTITVEAEEGSRLSDLGHQNSYRYVIARVYVGADDERQVAERFAQLVRELRFAFTPVDESEGGP